MFTNNHSCTVATAALESTVGITAGDSAEAIDLMMNPQLEGRIVPMMTSACDDALGLSTSL